MKCKYKKFLKAAYIDYEEDYCSSGSGTFTRPAVTTPIIVITGTTATIACATSGATIYYTLDGSTPTRSSAEYTDTITLTLSCTIKAIAVKQGMSDSDVASESYVHYLTTWKIVGNSEVHGNEIWSCGEYNATDGKYHILVLPLGGSITDIALDEPLRKVNDVADTIEFPSNAEGKALVTRNLACVKNLGGYNWFVSPNSSGVENYIYRMLCSKLSTAPKIVGNAVAVALCAIYTTNSADHIVNRGKYGIALSSYYVTIRDANYGQQDSASALKQHLQGIEFIYWIEPTTELVDAPQIEEADSYSCVISPGGKAVSWSSFETE